MSKWVDSESSPTCSSPLHEHTAGGMPLSNCNMRWFCQDFAGLQNSMLLKALCLLQGTVTLHPCTCAVPSLGHSLILTSAWFTSSKLRVQKHSHYLAPSGGTRILQGSWPLLFYLPNSHGSWPAYTLEESKVKTLFSSHMLYFCLPRSLGILSLGFSWLYLQSSKTPLSQWLSEMFIVL